MHKHCLLHHAVSEGCNTPESLASKLYELVDLVILSRSTASRLIAFIHSWRPPALAIAASSTSSWTLLTFRTTTVSHGIDYYLC